MIPNHIVHKGYHVTAMKQTIFKRSSNRWFLSYSDSEYYTQYAAKSLSSISRHPRDWGHMHLASEFSQRSRTASRINLSIQDLLRPWREGLMTPITKGLLTLQQSKMQSSKSLYNTFFDISYHYWCAASVSYFRKLDQEIDNPETAVQRYGNQYICSISLISIVLNAIINFWHGAKTSEITNWNITLNFQLITAMS